MNRDAMLDAAASMFAQRGVAATTLKDVALAANATAALVHYYFGSKELLAETVLMERLAPVLMAATAPLRAAEPLDLALLVATYTRAVSANPWVPQLLVREVLSEGGVLRARFIERVASEFAAAAPARIAEAQRAGLLRRDLDPRLIMLSVASLLAFPFVAAPVFRALGVAPGPAFADALIHHTTAVLKRGVEEPQQ